MFMYFIALCGRVIAVDEIHQYKNWAREIKNIYDTFPDLIIRISGSSMLNILYEKYDLSNRASFKRILFFVELNLTILVSPSQIRLESKPFK